MSTSGSLTWTHEEIVEIARWQRNLIRLILVQLAAFFLMIVLAVGPQGGAAQTAVDAFALLLWAGLVVAGVLSVCCVYRMAKALRKGSLAILYALAGLFSVIGLILILSLSSEATRVLQECGIRVGVMGANPDA